MLCEFFARQKSIERWQAGPLGPYVGGFAAAMKDDGHPIEVVRIYVRIVACLSVWMKRRRLQAVDLCEARLEEFLRPRKRRRPGVPLTVRSFLEHLRRSGVVGDQQPRRPTSGELLAQEYAEHLDHERGLAASTRINYLWHVSRFILEQFGTGPTHLDRIGGDEISSFVLRHARDTSPGSAQAMTTSLRSFLRFLLMRGKIGTALADCVPTVASWSLSRIPCSLTPGDIKRLVAACDRRTALGRRDLAVLLLLSRLGLRAREVVALTLDDIDWVAGEITLTGKGRRRDRLPLPNDVGAALAAYVRDGRPQCETRRLFVRARAPLHGFLGSGAVCTTVRRALRRAGLHPSRRGAHLLRHTAATQMLQRGASLGEIGDVLRHRNVKTTAIYAKVDLSALRALAPRWPGGTR